MRTLKLSTLHTLIFLLSQNVLVEQFLTQRFVHSGMVYVVAVMATLVFLVMIYETNVFIDVHDYWFCKCETIIFFFMVNCRFVLVGSVASCLCLIAMRVPVF